MTAPIERERTALRRTGLSSPMQHLLRFGFLDGRYSLFDYGCGRGDDLRVLERMNIRASGWDPVFRPDAPREPAEIVNLGFVLNVIEDARERDTTLKSAFQLAEKLLVVSVMLGYQAKREQFDQYQDGVRTQRNTFQKYFAQDEFRAYLESTLKQACHSDSTRRLPRLSEPNGRATISSGAPAGPPRMASAEERPQ